MERVHGLEALAGDEHLGEGDEKPVHMQAWGVLHGGNIVFDNGQVETEAEELDPLQIEEVDEPLLRILNNPWWLLRQLDVLAPYRYCCLDGGGPPFCCDDSRRVSLISEVHHLKKRFLH